MKKFILFIAVFLFVNELKAQHIEIEDWSSASSQYCEKPTVWLDGDSVRYSFVVHFPEQEITLLDDVNVWFSCDDDYVCDLYWTNSTRPHDVTVTYSGAKYVGELIEGNSYDIDYGAFFETNDQVYGVNSLISFRYYAH